MDDLISRQAAIDLFPNDVLEWDTLNGYIAPHVARRLIEQLPPAQPEPAIPLSWIDEQIERLKGLDNAFATLTALQISAMVNKWRDEQDETD